VRQGLDLEGQHPAPAGPLCFSAGPLAPGRLWEYNGLNGDKECKHHAIVFVIYATNRVAAPFSSSVLPSPLKHLFDK